MWDEGDLICVWKSLTTVLPGWKGNPPADKEYVHACVCVHIGVVGVGSNQHLLTGWCLWCLGMCWKGTTPQSDKPWPHTHNQTHQLWEWDLRGYWTRDQSRVYLFKTSKLQVVYILIFTVLLHGIVLPADLPYSCLSAGSYFQQINHSIFSWDYKTQSCHWKRILSC